MNNSLSSLDLRLFANPLHDSISFVSMSSSGNKLSRIFVSHYCRKIEQLGYSNKYKTFQIDVFTKGGRRYDLILATQSPGAANVLKYLKKHLSYITTESLHNLFSVSIGKQSVLDSSNN
jgi:hypothetical protein